jgi:protein-L-isoaspartate(D-aspartate) O-methyltransferase
MAYIDFIQKIHTATKRNYLQRVVEFDKAACAKRGKEFGFDYFDGERQYGYGGYRYIEGRMLPLGTTGSKPATGCSTSAARKGSCSTS